MNGTQLSPEAIPAALTARPQWVCWRYETRNGKRTKAPINAKSNGKLSHASSKEQKTWASLDDALAACGRHPELAGVGFCFAPDDDLTGIDLDHVIDPDTGELQPEALEILERFAGTYAEVSPSGTGLRLFCSGKPGRSGKIAGKMKWLEVYSHPSHRYLTVTGNHWPGSATVVTEQQAALDWLHARFMTASTGREPVASKPGPAGALDLDDAALLDKAHAARNGGDFERLWAGDTSGHGSDDSAADLALCNHLAFWTGGDADRIDRLFRQSGLMREKWDEVHFADGRTYGQATLDKAIAGCTTVYSGKPGKPAIDKAVIDKLDKEIADLEERWKSKEGRKAVKEAARDLINAHAVELRNLQARQRTTFVNFKERLIELKTYGARDFDAILKQAGETTEEGQQELEQAQLEWLKRFAFIKVDSLVADLTTGNGVEFKIFNLEAEKAFPNGWKANAVTHLARAQAPFFRHDCYYPGEPRIVIKEPSGGGPPEPLLNIYNKPLLPHPVQDAEHERLFYDHLLYISGGDKTFVEMFLNFCATMIQKPEQKINWIPVFISPCKGTGRGMLLQIITALLGKSNVGIITSGTLESTFHDALVFKQLIAIDEFRMFEDANKHLNVFKSYVTEPRIAANRKNRAQITVDNTANFIAFSNYESAIAIDRDERRYCVATCYEKPKPDTYYQKLARTFLPDYEGSVAGLLHMLRERDLSSFNPKAPAVETEARRVMIDQGMTPAQRAIMTAIEQRETIFNKDLFTRAEFEQCIRDHQSPFHTGGSLFDDFKFTAHSIARTLNAIGAVNLGQKRVGATGKLLVYAIRDTERWRAATESEIRDYLSS